MKKIGLLMVLIFSLFFSACSSSMDTKDYKETEPKSVSDQNKRENDEILVSFIDVGQGDSTLIKTPNGRYIIIDGGSKKEYDKLFGFLKLQAIKKIDAVIATHPHEDHIGNLDDIINQYEIGEVYAPKISANTKTFRDFMDSIQNKGLKIKKAESGVKFSVDNVDFEFIAPNSEKYEEINNYSSAVKVSYKEKSFLIMGDAEKISENEILKNQFDVNADVIKLGHHGSSSSSSNKFMDSVNPKYAVISCGKGNEYGHPHKEVLKLLNNMNVTLYRTDINGTISFISDGKTIKINNK